MDDYNNITNRIQYTTRLDRKAETETINLINRLIIKEMKNVKHQSQSPEKKKNLSPVAGYDPAIITGVPTHDGYASNGITEFYDFGEGTNTNSDFGIGTNTDISVISVSK